METRVLRYYLAVVAEGNISAAANALHITQPTLSRQIKELEEELDVTLFYRKGKTIELTKEGRYLAEHAKDIVRLIDKTTSNINQSEEIYGEVNLGLAESIAIQKIAHTIKSITESYSEIKYNLYSGNAEQIMEKLENGLLDFGVVIEPTNKIEYETLSLKASDQWGILTRKDSEFEGLTTIEPNMILHKPLMISVQRGVETMIANLLNVNKDHLNIIVRYNLLYNAALLVKEGVGHAITIDGIINTDNTDLKFIPFNPSIQSELSLIWKKDKPLSEASKVFLEEMKNFLLNE
ncbi:LysR family transcriptional regulator [Staphylococcus sp. HKU1]|uniref:LysR family transcriptional regulator n=1 Tax=Staphylococcus sp. HKU1 TaxID=3068989 RepID=UPI003AACC018